MVIALTRGIALLRIVSLPRPDQRDLTSCLAAFAIGFAAFPGDDTAAASAAASALQNLSCAECSIIADRAHRALASMELEQRGENSAHAHADLTSCFASAIPSPGPEPPYNPLRCVIALLVDRCPLPFRAFVLLLLRNERPHPEATHGHDNNGEVHLRRRVSCVDRS